MGGGVNRMNLRNFEIKVYRHSKRDSGSLSSDLATTVFCDRQR